MVFERANECVRQRRPGEAVVTPVWFSRPSARLKLYQSRLARLGPDVYALVCVRRRDAAATVISS